MTATAANPNKTKPGWQKEPEWHVAPVDWYRNPKAKRLRRADPANAGRWYFLVALATSCRAEGRLIMSDGTPWTVDDLADEYGDDPTTWPSFMQMLEKMELVSVSKSGIIAFINWSVWNRDAAKESLRDEDSYRKRLERQLDKESSTRMALEAELASIKGADPLLATSKDDDVQDAPGHVQDEPGPVQPVHVREEQSREEKIRSEKSRAEQKRADAPARDACPPSFDKDAFLRTCSEVLPAFTKSFSKRDAALVVEAMATSPWSGFSWECRAGALRMAVQRALYRLDQGEKPNKKLPWLLSWAKEHLEVANDIVVGNNIALEHGVPTVAMSWSPEDKL